MGTLVSYLDAPFVNQKFFEQRKFNRLIRATVVTQQRLVEVPYLYFQNITDSEHFLFEIIKDDELESYPDHSW